MARSPTVALPFVATDKGIAAGESTECFNPVAVIMRAEAVSRKEGHVGAVAFSRTGDPPPAISAMRRLKKFGDVPDDLSGRFVLAVLPPFLTTMAITLADRSSQ